MGGQVQITPDTGSRRYEAVVRISEALVACRQPEELAKTLADLLGELLSFGHLDMMIFKDNSPEFEWHAWGKGGPAPGDEDLPAEDLAKWLVYGDFTSTDLQGVVQVPLGD